MPGPRGLGSDSKPRRPATQRWGRLGSRLGLIVCGAVLLLSPPALRIATLNPLTPTCAVDDTLTAATVAALREGEERGGVGERYLFYVPQFGLANQLIALADAAVWALLLNRTLVLPHVLGHAGCANASLCEASAAEMAAHDEIFSLTDAAAARLPALRPLRVLSASAFLHLTLTPAAIVHLRTNIVHSPARASLSYLDRLGLQWHRTLPTPHLTLRRLDPPHILAAFGGCGHHPVLAFHSLFAALELKPGSRDFPPPGEVWLKQRALPAIWRPRRRLRAVADAIVRRLTDSGRHRLVCAHIRQGDLGADCRKYEVEAQSRNGRAFVKWFFEHNISCVQPPEQIHANLASLVARAAGGGGSGGGGGGGGGVGGGSSGSSSDNSGGNSGGSRSNSNRRLVIYAALEDPSLLRHPLLSPYQMSCLAAFDGVVAEANLQLPPGLLSALLDQLVCARADFLLINGFSTFSQLLVARIGLDHPAELGYTRNVEDPRLRRTLGVDVQRWRTLPLLDEAQSQQLLRITE